MEEVSEQAEVVANQSRNIGEALRSVQRGESVECGHFSRKVRDVFSMVESIVRSDEYSQLKSEIGELLTGVEGQDFIFDIEGVVMSSFEDEDEGIVYYPFPRMVLLIDQLIKNGNNVGFWTAASEQSLQQMRYSMPKEWTSLPAISRDDFRRVLLLVNQLKVYGEDVDMSEIVQFMCLGGYSSLQEVRDRLSEDVLACFDRDPEKFVRTHKLPNLVMPEIGCFVDDNNLFINTAVANGFPPSRVIKSDSNPFRNGQVRALASEIKQKMSSQE